MCCTTSWNRNGHSSGSRFSCWLIELSHSLSYAKACPLGIQLQALKATNFWTFCFWKLLRHGVWLLMYKLQVQYRNMNYTPTAWDSWSHFLWCTRVIQHLFHTLLPVYPCALQVFIPYVSALYCVHACAELWLMFWHDWQQNLSHTSTASREQNVWGAHLSCNRMRSFESRGQPSIYDKGKITVSPFTQRMDTCPLSITPKFTYISSERDKYV
jgi:hypothetical protein